MSDVDDGDGDSGSRDDDMDRDGHVNVWFNVISGTYSLKRVLLWNM